MTGAGQSLPLLPYSLFTLVHYTHAILHVFWQHLFNYGHRPSTQEGKPPITARVWVWCVQCFVRGPSFSPSPCAWGRRAPAASLKTASLKCWTTPTATRGRCTAWRRYLNRCDWGVGVSPSPGPPLLSAPRFSHAAMMVSPRVGVAPARCGVIPLPIPSCGARLPPCQCQG